MSATCQIPTILRAALTCAIIAIIGFSSVLGNDEKQSIRLAQTGNVKTRVAGEDLSFSASDPGQQIKSLQHQVLILKSILGCTVLVVLALTVFWSRQWSRSKSIRRELEKLLRDSNEKQQRNLCHEQQLVDRQKQESVSSLVGGIVHEFNNSLTSVVAQSEMGMYYEELNAKNAAFQQIVDVALQAAELASRLLAYSVRDPFEFGKVDLNQVVVSAQSLLNAKLRDRAQFAIDLTEVDAFVDANEIQLQQAVVNLMLNSMESLHQTQTQTQNQNVKIDTGCRQLNRDQLEKSFFADSCLPGSYCFVQVSDPGIGMDKESIRRMFDSTSSSKPKGCGLGLTSVLMIARSCHGAIDVESSPDTGTSITLFLPKFQPDVRLESNEAGSEIDLNQSTSVLFVDDDPVIRESAERVLASSGFEVLTASNSDQALQIANTHNEQIDCVVVDYLMPTNNGIWLATKLKHCYPQMLLILSSGFSETSEIDASLFNGFLDKPYFPNQLVETIRNVIGASK